MRRSIASRSPLITAACAAARCRVARPPLDSRCARWRSIASRRSAIPWPVEAATAITGGCQPVSSWRSAPCRSSRTRSSAPGRSALLTTSRSPISSCPALIACTPSPSPGTCTTTAVCANVAMSMPSCPVPTVSTRITG